MDPEQINRILQEKRIPLTNLRRIIEHYTMVFPALFLFFCCLYIYFDIGDAFGLFMAAPCLFFALFIIFYLGKKSLKLKKVQYHFADNRQAYIAAKKVFEFYKWDILEENSINYIKAFRADYYFIKRKSPWKGRSISVFIEFGNIYIISLYHPRTQAEIFGDLTRNVKLFENKINEFVLINKLKE
ncbi:MAG: hypothetical protein WCL06_15770 [Bacteroidota bacterium]